MMKRSVLTSLPALLLPLLLVWGGRGWAGEGGESPPRDAQGNAEAKGEKPEPKKEEGEEKPRKAELDAATKKILERLDQTHKKILSFQADYHQVRKVRISRRLRKAKGVLYIQKVKEKGEKGEEERMKVLFVETEPFRSKVLFTDTEVVFLDEESGEIQRRDPRQGGVKPSEIWVLGRPASQIEKHYTPRFIPRQEKEEGEGGKAEEGEEPVYLGKLELIPTSDKIRKWVRRIDVWLRTEDALGVKVRIVDRRGDYQEFVFDPKTIVFNPDLKEDRFKIE
ncbi:MAG: LolA family protein [Planctomycetota bacterium]|jgi:hypothetical protein